MDRSAFLSLFDKAPVICAIKDDAGLKTCLAAQAKVVFVLYGSILDLPEITRRLQAAGKVPIVHVDLVDGLAPRDVAVDYLADATAAAGIISTKPGLLQRARQRGLATIRRFFLLDSLAYRSMQQQLAGEVDCIEVLPGLIPKMIRRIVTLTEIPLIAGGLITDEEDVAGALRAGASAVSTSNPKLWHA